VDEVVGPVVHRGHVREAREAGRRGRARAAVRGQEELRLWECPSQRSSVMRLSIRLPLSLLSSALPLSLSLSLSRLELLNLASWSKISSFLSMPSDHDAK